MQATKTLASKPRSATEIPVPAPAITESHETPATAHDDLTAPILNRLLRMADNYRANGSLWQAEEMYRTLMDEFADTPQSEQARMRLMDLCEAYELDGQLHHARSLYERLL